VTQITETRVPTDEQAAPDPFRANPLQDELLTKARDLIPLLQRSAAAAERDRRLAPEVVKALRDAGMFALTRPRRHGGHQVDFRSFLAITTELGRGSASAAWVVMILAGSGYVGALYGDRAQEEVWGADPEAAICLVLTAPGASSRKVDGGHVVSGRWGFGSGVHHAQWIELATPITDEAGDVVDMALALIPVHEVVVEDTWFVAGMQGTGSDTVVVDEVFVPDHRILSMGRLATGYSDSEHPEEAEYRGPAITSLAVPMLGPLIGTVLAADELVHATLSRGKPLAYTQYARSIDSPAFPVNYARARSLIDSARLHAFRAADDVDHWARTAQFPPEQERARVKMDCGVAVSRLRESLSILLDLAGAGAFAQANPLNLLWRDFETASRHAFLSPDLGRELYGRALLGIEPQMAAF
jgi:alkylation response protein AidB-like acyl-CoA dehydrogenase